MKFRETVSDILVILGSTCVVYGAWMIFHPLGWIVGGLFCIVLGYVFSKEAYK